MRFVDAVANALNGLGRLSRQQAISAADIAPAKLKTFITQAQHHPGISIVCERCPAGRFTHITVNLVSLQDPIGSLRDSDNKFTVFGIGQWPRPLRCISPLNRPSQIAARLSERLYTIEGKT